MKVLRVDTGSEKISLGLKQLLGDPWATVSETCKPGQLRSGRVTRVADFGVFVELEPGIDGLLPASETGIGRDGDLKKAFPIGRDVQVVVTDVDPDARRIRLSVTEVQKLREADEVREYTERSDTNAKRLQGHRDRRRTRGDLVQHPQVGHRVAALTRGDRADERRDR